MKLDELTRILGLTDKPEGIGGGKVEGMVAAGKIAEVAHYCETDVVSTYRVFLIYESFCGASSPEELSWSEKQLSDYVRQSKMANPYLQAAMVLAMHR
jgi:predicted PolB exonuclease-like 3'-5' exonuclease